MGWRRTTAAGRTRRRARAATLALLAVVLVSAGVPGCGSGGGTPEMLQVCGPTVFTPNYVQDLQFLARWQHLPVSIYFVQDANASTRLQSVALAGFDQWASATDSKINYQMAASQSGADITVRFDPTMVNSVTNVSTRGSSVLHADMMIGLGDPTNPESMLPDADIQCSAAHEFGHALGIEGHSMQRGDLMYFAHVVGSVCPVTTRDLNTMKTAYCDLFPMQPGMSAARGSAGRLAACSSLAGSADWDVPRHFTIP